MKTLVMIVVRILLTCSVSHHDSVMKKAFILLFLFFYCQHLYSQTLVAQAKSVQNERWGYVDIDGKTITPPLFVQCFPFSSVGLAAIYDLDDRQYYFIDLKGNKLNTEIKDFKLIDGMGFKLEDFSFGLIPVKVNGKWGFMNTQGRLAIPAIYNFVTGFADGRSLVEKSGKYYVLSTDGTELKLDVPDIREVRKFSEGLAAYEGRNGFGFLNTDGKIAIEPRFETVGNFKNGAAWARLKGKLGYINPEGEWIIEPQFSYAGNFDKESGLARVKLGESWWYVDYNGKRLQIRESTLWEDFSEGLAMGKKRGKIGFFNSTGVWVISPQFDGARNFKNGYAAAKIKGRWGIIDKTGKWVVSPVFKNMNDMVVVDDVN